MNKELYKPTIMFFELTNSSAMFQMIMNTIFHNLITNRSITVYMNNIASYTMQQVGETQEEHVE
jgi:hypothetical protein